MATGYLGTRPENQRSWLSPRRVPPASPRLALDPWNVNLRTDLHWVPGGIKKKSLQGSTETSVQPLKSCVYPGWACGLQFSQGPSTDLSVEALNQAEALSGESQVSSTTKAFKGWWEVFSVRFNHVTH